MTEKIKKIQFLTEDKETVEFFVEEQTVIAGISYLLVSDSQDEEASAYIMKDVSGAESEEACYEMVEDSEELLAVWKVFQEMMDDVDLID